MIEIKLIIMSICALLFWWGGFSFLVARRFIMPIILTISALFFTQFDWWCLTMLATMGVFSLGYGINSHLRHTFGDGWGRGVWGLLGAIMLSLGLFLTGHVIWYLFLGYLVINFILENALKRIPQMIGDPIIGLGFASILLVIR